MKYLLTFFLLVSIPFRVEADSYVPDFVSNLGDFIGSFQCILQHCSSGLRAKTITSNAFESGRGGSGKVVNGVNLYTGQAAFSIPLGGVAARTVQFPIVLSYNGGEVKPTMDNDNQVAPASWVGLGFNLSFPFVAINHKGTYPTFDDVLYCNLGPYGGGQLLMDSAGTRFYVASNPYIKVDFQTSFGQFQNWTFTFPDGKKMVFGQDINSQRYLNYNSRLIKASPFAYVPAQRFTYRWDLSSFYDSIPNLPPRNKIVFEYQPYLDSAAANKNYVRESHIKNIKWVEGALEVERYEFVTTPKNANEYPGYFPNEMRDDQKLFETRRLDSLKCYKEGVLTRFYKFGWLLKPKSLLERIQVFHPKSGNGNFSQDSGWTFTYDGLRFNHVSTITYPNSRKDSYTYGSFNFNGTDGDRDPNDRMMYRPDSVTPVDLPTDATQLSKWKVESNCDERFCYSVVKDGDNLSLPGESGITQKIYVEIRRNLGNYFDSRTLDGLDTVTARFEAGDAVTTADEWKFIPCGNYVLLVGGRLGTVKVFEFDGVRWASRDPFRLDAHINGNFGGPIKVSASGSYFIVQKTTAPFRIFVAFRDAKDWKSMNISDASCEFSNKDNYGESIRNTASGTCLEWSRGDLTLNTASSFFTVLDNYTDILCVFALEPDGSGFRDISKKIAKITAPTGLQRAGYNMNWEKNITSVNAAGDYVLIQSQESGFTHLHGLYFDGDSLAEVFYKSRNAQITYQTYLSRDYFVLTDPAPNNSIVFYQRQSQANGKPEFGNMVTVRTDYDPTKPLQIRTHPNAFSVEYYPDSAGFGLRPRWQSAGGNYASYLFQVNRSLPLGLVDRTNDLTINGLNPFDLSFSGTENFLTARYASTSSSARCSESINTGGCIASFYTFRFHPERTSGFIDATNGDRAVISTNVNWNPIKDAHKVMSGAARLGTQITLDATGSTYRVRFRQYQFDGKGFASPDSQFVVTSLTSYASLTDENRNRVKYNFYYPPVGSGSVPSGISEFNCQTLSPQFEFAEVRQVNSGAATPGTVRIGFHLDTYGNPLSGKSIFLNGIEKGSRSMASNGDTATAVSAVNIPYRAPSWPKSLYVTRLKSTISQASASNSSHMSDTTYYYNFSDTNGAPRFVLQENRPEKILLSQRIFDGLGFTKQALSYKLPTQPDTFFLKIWDPERPYSLTGATAASKAVFDRYYFQEDSLWLERDQALTDADLRNGTAPTFTLNEGWVPGSKITLRDTANFFQVLESKVVKNTLPGARGESHTSTFYEGLRSEPVAVIGNAKLVNCAVLLGESGNAGLGGGALEHRGRWETGGSAFSSTQSHTGRYSLKVTDNTGPTISLYLKDVREAGYGFKVSAWIYADTGTPVLTVERRNSSGTFINAFAGAPENGSGVVKKTWQRWECILTNAQLTSGNLFNGAADYLRIRIGTGSATGQAGKTAYVDDIVCLPTNATFSLQTYDKSGFTTSATNSDHRTTYYDIGPTGRVMAVRDDKFRIFGQAAMHKMGEN